MSLFVVNVKEALLCSKQCMCRDVTGITIYLEGDGQGFYQAWDLPVRLFSIHSSQLFVI